MKVERINQSACVSAPASVSAQNEKSSDNTPISAARSLHNFITRAKQGAQEMKEVAKDRYEQFASAGHNFHTPL